jgi:hypothetical protein
MAMTGRYLAIAVAVAAMAAAFAAPAHADKMARAIFMNTSYCAGIAEGYSEALKEAGGWSRSGKASAAARVATELKRRAEAYGRRQNMSASEGARAASMGRSAIAKMLAGGNWRQGGDIPQEAYKQYQHCATLAEI